MNNADEIEEAKFVIFSLIRKLYALSEQSNSENSANYSDKIKQLQKDLKFADKSSVLTKVRDIYIPYLQQIESEA